MIRCCYFVFILSTVFCKITILHSINLEMGLSLISIVLNYIIFNFDIGYLL